MPVTDVIPPTAPQWQSGAMSPTTSSTDPWGRWGWLYGGIWLFFFLFPLVEVWTSDRTLPAQLAATGLIGAFCLVYVVTLRGAVAEVVQGSFARAQRRGILGLTVLIALAVALAAMIGSNSMTTLPFLVSLPVFFLPWRAMWATSLTIFGLGILGSLLAWGFWPASMLWGISVLVLGMSVMSRYLEESQEAAQEVANQLSLTEERERVARDVHDVLGHSLTVVTVKTELAARLIDVDPERAKQEMAQVQDLARQALAEIRATVGGLRVARLAEEVDSARVALDSAGIEAELPQDLSVVDPRHRITLAWVVREAVTNVVRHSRASRCRVELGESWVRVSDDGVGLDGRAEGTGLKGVRERVQQAGGTLTLRPGMQRPGEGGRGTELEVRW